MRKTGKTSILRHGTANKVVIVLLSAILVSVVALILVVTLDRKGSEVRDKDPPRLPNRVDNPSRIRETLRAGRTYRVVVKAGFEARVEDKDYGIKTVINLVYEAEMMFTREIESNDGKRVVELRHFEACRNVKLLTEVDEIALDLGVPGTLLLGAVEYLQPGAVATAIAVKPIAEAVLKSSAEVTAQDQATKAVAHVESISGKKVRITYLDGVGVESVEPIECSLSPSEEDFLRTTAVLSDCYLLPDISSMPGQTWTVEGSQFAGFLDPSMRADPEGEIVIRRGNDEQVDGKVLAKLGIVRGFLKLNSSDRSTDRIGTFTPRGQLRFNLRDGYVEKAELQGDLLVDQVSKDHILFEARFRTQPKLHVLYSCQMQ